MATTQRLSALETPAAVIDVDALEANIRAAAAIVRAAARTPVSIRPHAKAHKSPAIALRQIALSEGMTTGVCCQKLSEAAAMVDGGVSDVLLSNQVVDPRKLERMAALAARCSRFAVLVDEADNLRDISAAAERAGSVIGIIVEVDVGQRRCGVATPAEAVALARLATALPGVRFDGIQCYHGGAQHVRTVAERQAIGGCARVR
jgi:D-serine deaminase-like pyridoxal phosphate-dependent protein